MQIVYKESSDCDFFYFDAMEDGLNCGTTILLPQAISIGDLICFIQSSLDQIKPVILLCSQCDQRTIDLLECKKSHYKLFENNFLFLNFSIRNLLSSLKNNENKVIDFDNIQRFFLQFFQKNN